MRSPLELPSYVIAETWRANLQPLRFVCSSGTSVVPAFVCIFAVPVVTWRCSISDRYKRQIGDNATVVQQTGTVSKRDVP
jgi:hypothetical protein